MLSIDEATAPDAINTEEALAILRRLNYALTLADQTISSELRGQIWTVCGTTGGSTPVVRYFELISELCAYINGLRAEQLALPEQRLYLHIFYGQRWQIQKGRIWQLWDGKSFTPITGGDPAPYLDGTGELAEPQDFDAVLPNNPEVQAEETRAVPAYMEANDSNDEPEIHG